MTWWFGSFTSDAGFLGACYVEGVDAVRADGKAWKIAPPGAQELLMLGPISAKDMAANVPGDVRRRLIPPGHDHLADTSLDTQEMTTLGAENGYEVHVHERRETP